MLRWIIILGSLCAVALIALAFVLTRGEHQPAAPVPYGFVTSFGGGTLASVQYDPHIDYSLNPSSERFYVHIPHDYTGHAPYGLIVFISPNGQIGTIPQGWAEVLTQRHLLFVAPLGAGNDQKGGRRFGLAVLAAREMMQHYAVDPKRIYVSGLSGGARVAGILGFYQPDLFRGTIQNCGADFYTPVPKVEAESETDSNGGEYGVFDATPDEIAGAKQVRFALITGSKDSRHGNILDVYNGGFAKSDLQAKLFDVPGMAHETASPVTLNAALDFVETGK